MSFLSFLKFKQFVDLHWSISLNQGLSDAFCFIFSLDKRSLSSVRTEMTSPTIGTSIFTLLEIDDGSISI